MLKKILSLLLVCLMSLGLMACDDKEIEIGNNDRDDDYNDYYDYDDYYNDNVDYNSGTSVTQPAKNITLKELTSTGEILYDDFALNQFTCLNNEKLYHFYNEDSYQSLDTELFPFLYDGKMGYADVHGNVVIDAKYSYADCFSEGKAFVRDENGAYRIIDKTGKELITVPSAYDSYVNSIVKGSGTIFKNGKAILFTNLKTNGEYQIQALVINSNMRTSEFTLSIPIGTDGKNIRVVNTPEFAGFVITYSSGSPLTKKYALYDLTGREVWRVECNNTIYIKNGLTDIDGFIAEGGYMNIVNESGKWGLLNLKTGQVQIQCQYDYLGAYSEGLIEICKYGKWGYIDINGNEVIKPAFLYANSFANGRAFVEKVDGKHAVIDKTGAVVAEFSTLGYANMTGKISFETVTPFTKGNGLAIITAGYKKFMIITSDGRVLHEGDHTGAAAYISDKYIFDGEKMYEIVKS